MKYYWVSVKASTRILRSSEILSAVSLKHTSWGTDYFPRNSLEIMIDEGTDYFSTDLLGSIVSITDNYGYRDYKPQTARFTTLDPIRDGTNWFSYCNGDPVNFIDFWGLCTDEPNLAGVPPQYRSYLIEQYKKKKEKNRIISGL